MERWRGRVAIVTGASAGIGTAIAKMLAEQGMKVVATARRLDRLQKLSKESKGEIHAQKCDVTKEEDVIQLVRWTRENLGGVHVLVNNAGVYADNPIVEIDTEKYHSVFNTNVFGLVTLTREALKDMRERGVDDGHIFHINSISGQRMIDVPPLNYVYSASKHAVTVLTEGLRRELRDLKTKIRVTSISPGYVRTEIYIAEGHTKEESDKFYDSIICLESEDVANALLYALASPPHVQVHEITILPVQQDG
ncbi:hypothetical protein B566_EDAN011565 [Ephemera danica]|nr:hypothetical protein B566_EDAN011565 [Ephemera danica]